MRRMLCTSGDRVLSSVTLAMTLNWVFVPDTETEPAVESRFSGMDAALLLITLYRIFESPAPVSKAFASTFMILPQYHPSGAFPSTVALVRSMEGISLSTVVERETISL